MCGGLYQDRCGYPCRGIRWPSINPASEPLHGYKQMNPMVFCWSYPIRSNKYSRSSGKLLREKNCNWMMPVFKFEPNVSSAVLVSVVVSLGLLHMDRYPRAFGAWVQHWLDRDSAVCYIYKEVNLTDGEALDVSKPVWGFRSTKMSLRSKKRAM